MKAMELIDKGFEDSEFLYPYYRLQEAGIDVTVVGPEGGTTYRGKNGVRMTSDVGCDDVEMADFDVLVIPGGHAPDNMRRHEGMVRLVKQAFDQEKPVAAICHAAQLLIEADVLAGRKLTCFTSVKTDVKNAGGDYVDEEVVVDGNLVTSRQPGDLPAFMRETLKLVGKKPVAATA